MLRNTGGYHSKLTHTSQHTPTLYYLYPMALNQSNHPLITIITVVYNGAAHVEQCIQSVLTQSYTNIQYIIIDGGSTDGTVDIIQRYESQLHYWVSEPDGGIYQAMNKGLAKATGHIIGILNADDYYLPDALQTVATAHQQQTANIYYGHMKKLMEINGKSYFKPAAPNLSLMQQTMSILHPATFVCKKVYDEIGGFDEQYRISADYEFLLRAYTKGYHFQHIEQALTVFRMGGVSNLNCDSYREGYQILKQYNTGHQQAMKQLIGRCERKRRLRKIINTLANSLGLQRMLQRRQEKKWSH